MDIYDIPLRTLRGEPTTLRPYADKTVLLVNVASRCGLTPQYTGLERLHETYADKGFSVLGFPCNQFGGQEPGSAEEIETFCSTTYGITFPIFEKIEVNGDERHPLYRQLVDIPDSKDGYTGDIRWNFEKFLVYPGAGTIIRFSPVVKPEKDFFVQAIEQALGISV